MKLWRNTLWNFLGLIIPTLVALPSMALMARLLGVERFGLFMLAFAVLGYASIFDAGVTRAIIRSIAINKGQIDKDRVVMGTALWVVLFLSVMACGILYLGSAHIVDWLKVSPSVEADANTAFKVTAIVVPPTLIAMALFSYLEGAQQFARLNFYKTITGSIVAIFPVLSLLIEPSLAYAVLGLLVARLVAVGVAYLACTQYLGHNFFGFRTKILQELFSFGGWVTVSNIISPLMSYFDRFILSNLLGASQVAFYTAPAESIGRISVVPGALARTIFPVFSANRNQSSAIAAQAYKGLFLATITITIPLFLTADQILNLWLGEPYGNESAGVLRILIIGFFFNSLAQIPFARIQAYGQAKLTAFVHLVEFLPYLGILVLLIYNYGIRGAAIAWAIRVIVDFMALEFYSRQLEV